MFSTSKKIIFFGGFQEETKRNIIYLLKITAIKTHLS